MKEAFLRGDTAAEHVPVEPIAEPVRGRKAPEPRLHATFKLKARNHRRLKKLSGLIERDMVDILEEALEPHLERLIDEHGLRETFVKLDC